MEGAYRAVLATDHHNSMFRSIKTKITLSLLAVALLIALPLGIGSYKLLLNFHEESKRTQMELAAQNVAMETEGLFDHKAALLTRIAEGRETIEYIERYKDLPFYQYLNKFKEEFPVLTYVNADGREEIKVVHGRIADRLISIEDKDFRKKAIAKPNAPIISDLEWDGDLDEAVVYVALAKHRYFGDQFVGLFVGAIPVAKIEEVAKRVKLMDGEFVNILDQEGRIVTHPDKKMLFRKIPLEEVSAGTIAADLAAFRAGFIRSKILGFDGFTAYAPLTDKGWGITVNLSYATFIAPLADLRNLSVLAYIVLVVFVVGLASLIAETITTPLKQLTAATEAISKGDLSQKVDIRTADEVGTLNKSFNTMTEYLQSVQNKLVAAHEYAENIFKSMQDTLVVVNQDGKIDKVNRSAYALLGYEEHEMIGQPLSIILPDGSDSILPLNPSLLDDGAVANQERIYLAKDGSHIPVNFSSSPIHDDQGLNQGYVCLAQDIAEAKRAAALLADYQVRLRSLASQVVLAEERERRRIATELHDHVGQTLALLRIRLETVCRRALSSPLEEHLLPLGDLVSQLIGEIRSLTFELSPPILYELGLVAALRWLAEKMQANHDIVINVESTQDYLAIDEPIRVLLFQAVRELLVNAIKHAQAYVVIIRIDATDLHQLRITVQDDGLGFLVDQDKVDVRKKDGFGLFSIRERMDNLDGALTIASTPGEGTIVTLTIPMNTTDRG